MSKIERFIAEDAKREALECRRFARVLLRWGKPNAHREWMRRAIRYWKNFKHYSRRAAV